MLGGQSRQLLSLPSCFVSLQPKTSRHCRANSSSFSLPLGDLPSSFYLPSGHRISQFLSYYFALSASLNRNRSIFPRHFLFVAPRRLQTTTLDPNLLRVGSSALDPLSSDYLYCSSLRSQRKSTTLLLAFCSPAYSPNPNLSLSFLPHDRDLHRPSISARTRYNRTF